MHQQVFENLFSIHFCKSSRRDCVVIMENTFNDVIPGGGAFMLPAVNSEQETGIRVPVT